MYVLFVDVSSIRFKVIRNNNYISNFVIPGVMSGEGCVQGVSREPTADEGRPL